MPLNKSKGNMYGWIDFTWNVVKGECPHQCSYCYCKRWGKQRELHFDERELKTDLGHYNSIFVGSSCDMWAKSIPREWITRILKYCRDNDVYHKWLFQTKNPFRLTEFIGLLPDDTMLGTTIETNHYYTQYMGNSPAPYVRMRSMLAIVLPKMISIEPIMDFDLYVMVQWMKAIGPEFVSIGADSKGHNLPEPPADKVAALIQKLQEITEVKIKGNLNRILR